MKKIIQKLFILAAALFTVSCNGDLNISQDNKLSASNMWKDANDVTTSTKGIYYLLRKNFQNRYTSVFYWAEARVGNYMWSTPQMTDISTKDCTDVLYNTMTSETSVCSWNLLYTVIDQANAVLKYAPDITMTESEAGFAYGQAYFARAFCYFGQPESGETFRLCSCRSSLLRNRRLILSEQRRKGLCAGGK